VAIVTTTLLGESVRTVAVTVRFESEFNVYVVPLTVMPVSVTVL
jgi:hypothetical protein